jgi:hypothetical protein
MFISSYEFVTYSVHSQKVTRFLGNGFEFLANANNMGIHGAGGREILVAPDLVEKALAAQRLSGVTEKVLEQLKLLARELHALSPAHDLVRRGATPFLGEFGVQETALPHPVDLEVLDEKPLISGSPLLSTRKTACGAPRPFSKSRHGQRRHHPTPNCAA